MTTQTTLEKEAGQQTPEPYLFGQAVGTLTPKEQKVFRQQATYKTAIQRTFDAFFKSQTKAFEEATEAEQGAWENLVARLKLPGAFNLYAYEVNFAEGKVYYRGRTNKGNWSNIIPDKR